MNRRIYLLIMWLCSLSVVAQTEGYDPSNPPLPDFPVEEVKDTTYTLAIFTSPMGAIDLVPKGGQYKAGQTVNLQAGSQRSGMRFMYWMDDEGNTLTTSPAVSYVMPKRDVRLTAVYRYVPEDPALPNFPEGQAPTYHISVTPKPAGAGSTSYNDYYLGANTVFQLYAYSNSHFYFDHWENAEGEVISTAQGFYFTMPASDTQLYAVYRYDPANPDRPGKNHYDRFTGEVIVDDFRRGDAVSAIDDVADGDRSNITSITIAGPATPNDFGAYRDYPSCTIFDMSRASGCYMVPAECFYANKTLNRILLPDVSSIEDMAFAYATGLSDVTCYAKVPPRLGNSVFVGTQGLVVYVPSSSVDLYLRAEGWREHVKYGNLTILPIPNNACSLEVNLPDACADGRYKNMPLELLNLKNGQRFKYVVTDRLNYTFTTLTQGCRYVALLKNATGGVLAKSDTVTISERNVSTTFDISRMKQLRTLQACVETPAGTDVTSQCGFTWYDEAGNYLSQTSTLDGQVSQQRVRCAVVLPQSLAMEYAMPADTLYEVQETDNRLLLTLRPLAQTLLTGRLLDVITEQPLGQATVTASQTLNGRYTKSVLAKTDAEGYFSMPLFVAPTMLTLGAADYVSQTLTLEPGQLPDSESCVLPDVQLKPISGATITTSFSYTTSVPATMEPEVQNYYADQANVAYDILNLTTGQTIRDFSVQLPNIVLLEEVSPGDSLQLTARSKTGSFRDIVVKGRLDGSLRMSVGVPVVQWGGVDATFTTTENTRVLGILYDAQGNYVNKYTYTSSTLSIRELPDGQYTLITMGESDFFSSIYNLDKFTEAGLQPNVDYLVSRFGVTSGVITPVRNVLVPFFDESRFYYTGDKTSFTTNKTTVVAGNYLTFTAKVDIKDVYRNSISHTSLSVELPEGTTLVDGSVMVGSELAFYEMNGRQLTIPLSNNALSDRIRFCVIPLKSGLFQPNATIGFRLGQKQVSQPIGSASYYVQDLTINVPEQSATEEVTISGLATGRADVVVYANGNVLGTTRALANGFWSLTAELPNPYNQDEFDIFAKIHTTTGLDLQTTTHTLTYNIGYVSPLNVEMSFLNEWLGSTVKVVFDLEHASVSDASYMFYHETDFTFAAQLTPCQPGVVNGVTIRVYTSAGEWVDLEAVYSEKLDKWIAHHVFGGSNLPVGVKVKVDANEEPLVDTRFLEDAVARLGAQLESEAQLKADMETADSEAQTLLEEGEALSAQLAPILSRLEDELTEEETLALVDEFMHKAGISAQPSEDVPDDLSIDDLLARGESLLEYDAYDEQEVDSLLAETRKLLGEEESIIDYSSYFKTESDTIQFVDAEGVTRVLARVPKSEIDFSQFDESQTMVMATTSPDANLVVYFNDDVLIVDNPLDDTAWRIVGPEAASYAKALARRKASSRDASSALSDGISILKATANAIFAKVNDLCKPLSFEIERLEYNLKFTQDKFERLLSESASRGMRVKDIESQIKALESKMASSSPADYQRLLSQKTKLQNERKLFLRELDRLVRQRKQLESSIKKLKGSKMLKVAFLGEIMSWYSIIDELNKIIQHGHEAINDILRWNRFINSILPCKEDESAARTLKSVSESNCLSISADYVASISITGIAATINGFMTFNPAAKTARFLVKSLVGVVTEFLDNVADKMYKQTKAHSKTLLKKRKAERKKLKCYKPDDDDGDDDDDNDNDPPYPTSDPIHDPSGYVYEGVSTNRLQGVTATCYYKELVEDMYGDLHENVVLWNAEDYAQRNPLFTDENGFYQWDVPQGLWQVRFEKEGYVPAKSDWLPVPPPQMDVNIGMVQNAQPEVVGVRAYEDGVEIEFSKYMDIETLTEENLFLKGVKDDEETLLTDYYVDLLNAEPVTEGSDTEYATKVKLATDQLGYYDEAYLLVSNGVCSYAGIPMAHTFEQRLDVEKKVRQLLVDTVCNVAYGGQKQIILAAIPADAAAGKKLSVKSVSEMIATADEALLTFDADGQVCFTVTGELYGTTALRYQLVDADLEARSIINVVDPAKLLAVKAPVASRISGTAVYRGQTVALSCESEGATIYYTTDGSCPCEDAKRIKYERPITIQDSMTIRFMAVGANFDESDVQECTYTIRQSDVKLNLSQGWNWNSHDLALPVSVGQFDSAVSRILTQTDEVILDPIFGLVGPLTAVDPAVTMKVEASEGIMQSFVGEQYNPALSPILLQPGWNWLGYPISQTLALSDALSYLEADEGDCISHLVDGFATFTDGRWEGSLQTLSPGAGYLYKSGSAKTFIYNTVPTMLHAKSIYGHRLVAADLPWQVDKHRYPDLMPVVAQLCYAGGDVADSTYYVAAFAGDECRGVGRYADGKLYLSVYGDRPASLTFQAWNEESQCILPLSETLTFRPDVVGSVSSPFTFRFAFDSTGVTSLSGQRETAAIYNLQGIRVSHPQSGGIYIFHTTDAHGHTKVSKRLVP